MKRKILTMMVVIAVIISMMPVSTAHAEVHWLSDNVNSLNLTTGVVVYSNGSTETLPINNGDTVFLEGDVAVTGSKNVCLKMRHNGNLTLVNVTIDNSANNQKSAIYFTNSTFGQNTYTLTLVGDSHLTGFSTKHPSDPLYHSGCGIRIHNGCKLTIDSSTEGSLTAIGGYRMPGIGFTSDHDDNELIINGGNIYATGGCFAAGIGGEEYTGANKIVINGGNVTATGGNFSTAIGCGNYSGDGSVTINGGVVNAYVSSACDSAIGSGYGSGGCLVTINGGEVYAAGNDGNGSVYKGGDISPQDIFSISGDAVVFLQHNNCPTPSTDHTLFSHEIISSNSAYGYNNIPDSWSGIAYAYLPLDTLLINDSYITAYGSVLDINSISTRIDTIQIDTTNDFTIKDTASSAREIETEALCSNIDLTVEDVSLDVSGVTDVVALDFMGINNMLTLVGDSSFTSANSHPAISVETGEELSINSTTDGSLIAFGSIGSSEGTVSITGGQVYSSSYNCNLNINGNAAVFGENASSFSNISTTSHIYVDSDIINNNSAYGYSNFPDSWEGRTGYGYLEAVTITYNHNDTSTPQEDYEIYYRGAYLEELSPEPTLAGYIFNGWHYYSDGTEPVYIGIDKATADDTLYASWVAQGTFSGVLKGELTLSEGTAAEGCYMTLESRTTTDVTDSNGNFNFGSVYYINHTLIVRNNSGAIVKEYAVAFTEDTTVGAVVDEGADIIDITYTGNVTSVSIPIELNAAEDDAFVNGDVIFTYREEDDVVNPRTGDNNSSYWWSVVAMVVFMGAMAGAVVIKKHRTDQGTKV